MKEETARGRAGVDGVRQALELDSLLLEFTHEIDQVLDAPTKPMNSQMASSVLNFEERLTRPKGRPIHNRMASARVTDEE